MTSISRYIWLAIALAALAFLAPALRDIYLAETYGILDSPVEVKVYWDAFISIVVISQNIAAALWLRYIAGKQGVAVLTWSVFGLFFGLIAVAIFYLVRISEKLET